MKEEMVLPEKASVSVPLADGLLSPSQPKGTWSAPSRAALLEGSLSPCAPCSILQGGRKSEGS